MINPIAFSRIIPPQKHIVPNGIKKTAELIKKMGFKSNTVLYPASGIDADGVTNLFPSAENYVGMDDRPFLIDAEKNFQLGKTLAGHDWNAWEDIDDVTTKNGAFVALCQRLRKSGFRIRRIIAFFENRIRISDRKSIAGLPISNGLIVFDKGNGTPIKKYWHIDFRNEFGLLSSHSPSNVIKLFEILDSNPPDTVLVKGAMGSLRSRDYRRGDLPPYIEKWLKERHGILVEGFNSNGEGEFYFRKERSEKIYNITLSYDPGVRIVKFP